MEELHEAIDPATKATKAAKAKKPPAATQRRNRLRIEDIDPRALSAMSPSDHQRSGVAIGISPQTSDVKAAHIAGYGRDTFPSEALIDVHNGRHGDQTFP